MTAAEPARAELQEFRLTFGVRHAYDAHPTFPAAHPDGYVAVLAVNYEDARRMVLDRIGRAWGQLYVPSAMSAEDWARFFPRGEIARFTATNDTTKEEAP